MARVLPEYAAKGSTVHLEITVDHEYLTVPATTDRLPLFNPAAQDRLRRVELAPISSPDGALDGRHQAANTYDAIVVGGGHNGLINAAYLAKAGLQLLVLERRGFVGGAAITEELAPGLLVHDVLLRAEPAAAGDHPRARPGQARLHAADDADVVRTRWTTATTSC